MNKYFARLVQSIKILIENVLFQPGKTIKIWTREIFISFLKLTTERLNISKSASAMRNESTTSTTNSETNMIL